MPSNIFANTGTNVSILFLDASKSQESIFLIDGSKLGTPIKDGKNLRTVLSQDEEELLIESFLNRSESPDFAVLVPNALVSENDFSLNAGRYFQSKFHADSVQTSSEVIEEIDLLWRSLEEDFKIAKSFEKKIEQIMRRQKKID
jgi:type I restriction enzyme M protein